MIIIEANSDVKEILCSVQALDQEKARDIALKNLPQTPLKIMRHFIRSKPLITKMVLVYSPFWLITFRCYFKRFRKWAKDTFDVYVLADAITGKLWAFRSTEGLKLTKIKAPKDKILRSKAKLEEIIERASRHIKFNVLVPILRRAIEIRTEVLDVKEFYRPTWLIFYRKNPEDKYEEIAYIRADKIPY